MSTIDVLFLKKMVVKREEVTLRALFPANIAAHVFGIGADFWGLYDGALWLINILPVQIVHLFTGVGSLIYLLKINGRQKVPS